MFHKALVRGETSSNEKVDERFHEERFMFANVKQMERCEEKLRNK